MNIKPLNPVNTVSKSYLPEQGSHDTANRPIRNQEPPNEEKQKPVKLTREDAENLAGVMNQISELFNRSLQFKVFDETDRLYVQIINKETKEVIKQIPPQEMLELSAKIKEMVGILFDKCV